MDQYVPGTCNIGAHEKRARAWIGVSFALISVFSAFMLIRGQFRWFLFVPLFISALGFIQARQNFCVYYGLKGEYNFRMLGKSKIVLKKEQHKKDVNHSLVLIFAAAVIAAGATVIFMII